ncbi:cell division protein ZipA [Pasteurellaceae bacterium LIM206]|nr:cell division protein ZipA [Pasteurellaceae bacterium LIM206]
MDLNTILIILGILALIALVVHGLWSNRREKSQYFQNANAFGRGGRQGFTANGNNSAPTAQPPAFAQPKPNPAAEPAQQSLNFERDHSAQESAQPIPQSVDQIKITLPNVEPAPESTAPVYEMRPSAPVSPEPQHYQQPAQPIDYAQQSIAAIKSAADEEESINSSSPELRVQLQEAAQFGEPVQTFNQSPISKPTLQQPLESSQPSEPRPSQTAPTSSFIMLYIVAPENRQFQGAALAQALDDLGFLFGEGNIYHRHLDLTVASPVIFSVANINQPGTFNPYTMHDFLTVGVAMFMQLPSAGNDRANLKIMLRTAKSLADQLGGFVLTDEQEIFTEAAEQAYLAKVN